MKKKIFLFLFAILMLFQFFPVDRNNPEIGGDLRADKDVSSIFRKSCYDCHSNETKWPFYSYIFPFSVLVSNHVTEGREELNFSEWENLSDRKKEKKSKEIIEEIETGEMPPMYYSIIHRNTKLTKEEFLRLKEWALKYESDSLKESE